MLSEGPAWSKIPPNPMGFQVLGSWVATRTLLPVSSPVTHAWHVLPSKGRLLGGLTSPIYPGSPWGAWPRASRMPRWELAINGTSMSPPYYQGSISAQEQAVGKREW